MPRLHIPDNIGIDFETEAIENRPKYPPKPVGVSIKEPGWSKPRYFAWGHPTKNNCSLTDAKRFVKNAWKSDLPKLFHNGKFDVDVAEIHMDMPRLSWDKYHDTLFLAFLHNPDSRTLSLKPLAMELLGMSPKEQEDLRGWIMENVPEAKKKPKNWGAYIARAPGDLVGRYGIGDDLRTERLFHKLYADIVTRGMEDAYNRERRLMPILLDSERRGIRVDWMRLRKDEKHFTRVLEEVDNLIRKSLKAPNLDVDSNDELADALDDAEKITDWILTKKGNRSTAKKALIESLDDKRLLAIMLYRGALATFLRTFMRPWLVMADATGGWIHTNWNQVRQGYHGSDRGVGARTGRLSSTPNFQNMPHPDKLIIIYEMLKRARVTTLPPLPKIRGYIIPDTKHHVILVRDYSQQEVRILAHFEDGTLCEAYNKDPRMDVHKFAQDLINGTLNTRFDRKAIKITGLGMIYGLGVGKLSHDIGTDVKTARTIRNAYLSAIPGLKQLNREMKQRAAANAPIKTWGGREYYVEPPLVRDGEIKTFDYKLLNRLIQGSAADNTKEATIRYVDGLKAAGIKEDHGRFAITVHDETVGMALRRMSERVMKIMREAMESVEFDVPMLTDGSIGERNWADLKKEKA